MKSSVNVALKTGSSCSFDPFGSSVPGKLADKDYEVAALHSALFTADDDDSEDSKESDDENVASSSAAVVPQLEVRASVRKASVSSSCSGRPGTPRPPIWNTARVYPPIHRDKSTLTRGRSFGRASALKRESTESRSESASDSNPVDETTAGGCELHEAAEQPSNATALHPTVQLPVLAIGCLQNAATTRAQSESPDASGGLKRRSLSPLVSFSLSPRFDRDEKEKDNSPRRPSGVAPKHEVSPRKL